MDRNEVSPENAMLYYALVDRSLKDTLQIAAVVSGRACREEPAPAIESDSSGTVRPGAK